MIIYFLKKLPFSNDETQQSSLESSLKRLPLLSQFHILLFYVLAFHAVQIGRSISRPSFSRSAFSAPPSIVHSYLFLSGVDDHVYMTCVSLISVVDYIYMYMYTTVWCCLCLRWSCIKQRHLLWPVRASSWPYPVTWLGLLILLANFSALAGQLAKALCGLLVHIGHVFTTITAYDFYHCVHSAHKPAVLGFRFRWNKIQRLFL